MVILMVEVEDDVVILMVEVEIMHELNNLRVLPSAPSIKRLGQLKSALFSACHMTLDQYREVQFGLLPFIETMLVSTEMGLVLILFIGLCLLPASSHCHI